MVNNSFFRTVYGVYVPFLNFLNFWYWCDLAKRTSEYLIKSVSQRKKKYHLKIDLKFKSIIVAEDIVIVMTFIAKIEGTYLIYYTNIINCKKLDNFLPKTKIEKQNIFQNPNIFFFNFKIFINIGMKVCPFLYFDDKLLYFEDTNVSTQYTAQYYISTNMNLQKKIFVSQFNLVTFVFSTILKPKFWPIWFILLKKGFILKNRSFSFKSL